MWPWCAWSSIPGAELVWAQEEPRNMGAWTFIQPYLEETLASLGRGHERPRYVGRKTAASPAAGYIQIHRAEQEALVHEALTLETA